MKSASRLFVVIALICAAPAMAETMREAVLRKVALENGLRPVEESWPEFEPEKAEVGKLLFESELLSLTRNVSCRNCHLDEFGTADGLPLGHGAGGVGKGIERMVLTRAGVIDYTGAPPGFAEGILRTLAGPSMNALSAGIGYALLASGAADAWHPFAQTALATFSVCSLILTAINFLPAIPFDGGLVLQSVLSRFLGDSRGRTLAAWISLALLGAMAALEAWLIQPILLYLAVTIGHDNWRKHLRPVADPAAIASR